MFPEVFGGRDTNRKFSFWGVELSGREVLTLWGRKTGLITVSLSQRVAPKPLVTAPGVGTAPDTPNLFCAGSGLGRIV